VEFVLGTLPCPAKDHQNFPFWNRCNNMVVSWLVHSVSLPIRQSIIWMDSAQNIWNDLKTRYSPGDLSRISDLQLEVASLNQGDLSVTEYFTKLRIIWDELDNFRPIPICTCSVKCSCLVNSIISQRKCDDHAMQFLRGLNDQYSNIRSHVLLMEPIPLISKIFSLIAQQERQLANHISVSISSINNVDSTRTSSSTLCTFCGKHVHTENVCFRKVGFPNHDNRNSKSNTRKVCTYCNRNGHTVDTCYKKHGYPPGYKSYNSNRTNQINSLITTDGVFSEPCLKEQEKRDYQLTTRQIQIINDVLRQNNNDTPPNPIQVNQVGSFSADPNAHELSSMGNSWIVDFGTTDHVCMYCLLSPLIKPSNLS